jgi:lipopolysaccharide export system protein LptA
MTRKNIVLTALAAGLVWGAVAQVPEGTRLGRPSMPLYRSTSGGGKMLDCVVNGSSVSNLNGQTALVTDFCLTNFRNGDAKRVELIAQAPQCEVDVTTGMLRDAGPLQVFTPTTNLFVQGVGFTFVQSNRFLVLSNQVETRVLKTLLKSSKLAAPAHGPAAPAQVVKIFADGGQFSFESNRVDYAGNVHLIDPQLDLTCDYLTIHLSSNGGVQNMLARRNVVLTTTNNGRATGAVGFYYVTNGDEFMRLTTNAIWHNGAEEAHAREFTYNSTRHFLTGEEVKVRWPMLRAGAGRPGSGPVAATNILGFRELFARFATLQFPPTNGPVEEMIARGNVLMVNQADDDSAMADEAVYERLGDSVVLTGNPVWWNTNMEVKGERLSAEFGAKTYHATSRAHFKMKLRSGVGDNAPGAKKRSTNQWLYISSDEIQYETNLAVFQRAVDARLLVDDHLRDTLRCSLLRLNLSNNQVESAFASGQVRGETAPDAAGVIKTIACEALDAFNSPVTGRIEHIDANTNVVIVEKGTNRGAPYNSLAAETVNAWFSQATNQLEGAVAERHVVFDQRKDGHITHATSDHALYVGGGTDQVKLTGSPLARNDNYIITNSDYLLWRRTANVIIAAGRYQILPFARPLAKNQPHP